MVKVFVEDKSKSLNENIDMVLKSNLSKIAKRRTLIEVLGISSIEANYFMSQLPTTPRAPRKPRDVFKFLFGVEIEMFANQGAVMAQMNERNIKYRWTGSYHHNNGNDYFDFKHDGSITRSEGRDGEGHEINAFNSGIECVSPVLKGDKKGLDTLKSVCEILNATGAQTNKSTGLHIHISTEGMNDAWFVNVSKNYQALELVIDTFMAPSRRGSSNHYCQSLLGLDYSNCNTICDIVRVNGTRYRKLNAEAYNSHRTIEFRQHGGTTSYAKISNWLSFCAKLIKWSKDNLITSPITCVDEIPFLDSAEKMYFTSRVEAFNNRNRAR